MKHRTLVKLFTFLNYVHRPFERRTNLNRTQALSESVRQCGYECSIHKRQTILHIAVWTRLLCYSLTKTRNGSVAPRLRCLNLCSAIPLPNWLYGHSSAARRELYSFGCTVFTTKSHLQRQEPSPTARHVGQLSNRKYQQLSRND